MYKFFQEQLDSKINNHNLRTLMEYCPIDAVRVKKDDKEYLMMASNNYLGLTFDQRVIMKPLKGLNNMVLVQAVPVLYLVHFHCLQNLKRN